MKKVTTYQISLTDSEVPGEYELADRNGNTVIDHLTEAQVIQLSEML